MCFTKYSRDEVHKNFCKLNQTNPDYQNHCNSSGNSHNNWIDSDGMDLDTNNNIHIIPYNSTTNIIIDTTKFNFPNEIWYMLPKTEVEIKTGTFIPLILLGVIGNILLLNIIIRTKTLRTPTNLLIGNMATADLLALLICPGMFMYHDFYQNYVLGKIGCKIEGFLLGAFLVTSVLNLVAVSYDRLTAIVLPKETRLNLRSAKIVMLSTWILGFSLSAPLAFYRTFRERQWKNFLETYCSENTEILPMYWHVLISALVWFPLTVMVICYSAIFWKLDRYEQEVLKREHPISVSYKMKVAKMLFIILIIFIILRVPFTALIFVRNQMLKASIKDQVQGNFKILWYTSHYLIFLNSAINPIIYGLTNDNYRRAFHQLPFLRIFCKEKINGTKEKKFSNRFHGILQPRKPCFGNEKDGSGLWFILTNKKKTTITTICDQTKSSIETKLPTSSITTKIDEQKECIIENEFI